MALLVLKRREFVQWSILQAGADQSARSRMSGGSDNKAYGWAGWQGLAKEVPFKNWNKEHEVCFPLDAIGSKTIASCYKHLVVYPVLRECRKPKSACTATQTLLPKSICFLIHTGRNMFTRKHRLVLSMYVNLLTATQCGGFIRKLINQRIIRKLKYSLCMNA